MRHPPTLSDEEAAKIDRDIRAIVERAMMDLGSEHGLAVRRISEEELPEELREIIRGGKLH